MNAWPRHPNPARTLLVLVAVLATGCAGSASAPRSFLGDEAGADSIRIHVTNLNFMDATLWALTPGTRKKLGVVTGKRVAIYTLPWEYSTDLQIELDILSGPRCTTEALPVNPGDNIELIIDVEMIRSPLCRGYSPR